MQKYFKLSSYLLGLVLCLFFWNCSEAPQRNCAAFKTGKYTFSSLIDGDTLTTTFLRTKTTEIEQFKGHSDTSSIRWINDCEYILKKLYPKNRAEEKSVHIKILTTTDSSYTFEFGVVGETNKLKGTAIKTN